MEHTYSCDHKASLGQLMKEGTVDARILDKLLGCYTLFEYRDGKCFRVLASKDYLRMLYRDEDAAAASWDRDLMETVMEEDRAEVFRALADGETDRSHCRFRHLLKDGSCIWLNLEVFLLKKEADSALYCGILRDVTKETEASAAQMASESALQAIFHISAEDVEEHRDFLEPKQSDLLALLSGILPIGMIGGYCEEGFPLYFVSRELYRMLGYSSYQEFETAIQGKVANTIYYEDLERVSRDLGSDYHVGMEYATAYRMPRKDGSLFWVLDKGRVVRAEDGRLAILSFCMDITEIMGQMECLQHELKVLERQNQDLQYLNNTVPVGYHRCADTPDYDFTFVSNRFAQMLGYTRQEIRDLFDDKFKNMVHPEDWARLFDSGKSREEARKADHRYEYRIKAKDGERWVLDQTDYVTGMGEPFFQGAILDITERVRLREELKTSVKAFRVAAREAGNLVFTYSRGEQTIYCDEEIAAVFGVGMTQPGVPYGIVEQGGIISKDTEDIYIAAHEAILRGEREAGGIVKLSNAMGQENVYELKLQTVFDDDGQPTDLAVGIYKDITDQYYQIRELEKTKETLLTTREKLRTESQEQLDMIYALGREYYALWRLDLDHDLLVLRRSENLRTAAMEDRGQNKPQTYSESLLRFAQRRVHPEDREMLLREAGLERIRERLAATDAYSVRVRRTAEGASNYTYVEWRIVRLVNSSGGHTALIAVKDVEGDVLEEAQQQSLLKDALSVAEHASRAKTTFLSNMSHDIRTPMNAIIGFTSIAASHIDNKERVQDCLEKIMASSNHLLSLINDILDMSRIESGRLTIQEKECNLSERIHNLVDMIRPQMRAKRLEFFVDTIDIRDEDLIFDPLRLDQVLINILSNAVKFTPSGGMVSFTIRQRESAIPGCGHYEFIVKDTGIGMSESFQKRIFDPFEREKSSTISGIEGTGLGMAITKNTVDMMGGTIDIKSQPNKGSTFTVTFDFKRQDTVHRQAQLEELEGLRALVVDDDFNVCDSVTKMLAQIGMRSEWTTSGREAVFRAQKAHDEADPFYSYIIDWLMPQMDGIETARRIRKVVGDEAPIIILAAYDWTDIEEEARAAGVTAFCNKPLFMSDLRNVMTEAGRSCKVRCEQAEKLPLDFRFRRVLVTEDNELNREIVTEILESRGFEVETASDGSIAVEMVRQSEEGYYDLVLMDIQMPVMDGYEATRAIRYLPRRDVTKLPIIAMTANAFEEDKERALQNGMNAHIAKPLQVDSLLATLSRILGTRQDQGAEENEG